MRAGLPYSYWFFRWSAFLTIWMLLLFLGVLGTDDKFWIRMAVMAVLFAASFGGLDAFVRWLIKRGYSDDA